MIKEKLKKILFYSLIIFLGLSATIAFYFFLSNQTGTEPWIGKIIGILRPFIIGGVIAYILKSTCNLFEGLFKKALLKSGKRSEEKAGKISSVISLVLTYVIWTTAIVLLIVLVAEQFVGSLINLVEKFPVYVDNMVSWVNEKLAGEQYADVRNLFNNTVDGLMKKLSDTVNPENLISTNLGDIASTLISGATSIVSFVIDFMIGLVVSVLLLAGRKKLAEKAKLLINGIFKENLAKAILDEFRFADRMFSGFLEGKVIDSTLIGVIYYIFLMILGVEYAPLIAVICGVTNIIPIFGPFLGAIPSSIIILTENPLKVIWFVLFVCVMQFIDGYIIDPHIVGGNIKVSSLSVLFAVTLFGGLWGFVGLLVGVPVFAVLYDIIKRIVVYFLNKKGKGHLVTDFKEKYTKKKTKNKKKNPVGENLVGDGEAGITGGEENGGATDEHSHGEPETSEHTESYTENSTDGDGAPSDDGN